MNKPLPRLSLVQTLAVFGAALSLGCTGQVSPNGASGGEQASGAAGSTGSTGGGGGMTPGPVVVDDDGRITDPLRLRGGGRHVAAPDPRAVSQRRARRVRLRRRRQRARRRQLVGNFAAVGAATVVTSDRGVEQYQAAIERRRGRSMGRRDASGTHSSAACRVREPATPGPEFHPEMGRSAWRRPLESAELDRLAAVATAAASELGSACRRRTLGNDRLFTLRASCIAQSSARRGRRWHAALDRLRAAGSARVSVWNSLPDTELLDQAVRADCSTARRTSRRRTRMLDVDRPDARRSAAFAEEFMRLDRIATQAKEPAEFTRSTARRCKPRWSVTCATPGRRIAFDEQRQRARAVLDHESRGQRGARPAVRPRRDRPRPPPRSGSWRCPPIARVGILEQGGLPLAVREPEGGLAHLARKVHPRVADVHVDAPSAGNVIILVLDDAASGQPHDQAPAPRAAPHEPGRALAVTG